MRTPHLDRIGLLSTIVFSEKMTSHMVADTSLEHLHGSGAQLMEAAGSSVKIMGSASLICTYLRSRGQPRWNSKSSMRRNRPCQWRCLWQTETNWSSEAKTLGWSRHWQVLKTIGTWRCWSMTVTSSYVLISGHHVTYVQQTGVRTLSRTICCARSDNDWHVGLWDSHQAEGQFEPRTNWCRGQNPQHADAGRRWGADANGKVSDKRGISYLAVRRDWHFVTVSRWGDGGIAIYRFGTVMLWMMQSCSKIW